MAALNSYQRFGSCCRNEFWDLGSYFVFLWLFWMMRVLALLTKNSEERLVVVQVVTRPFVALIDDFDECVMVMDDRKPYL